MAESKSLNQQLYEAAAAGNIEEMEMLLGKGADPNASGADFEGKLSPCIVCAAIRDRTEAVQLLLLHGAAVDAADYNDVTALGWAALIGNLDLTRILLAAGGDPSQSDNGPLFSAADDGYAEIVRELISHGADVDSRFEEGSTALIVSASRGHAETVEALLSMGANVTLADENGCTALYWSLQFDDGEELPEDDAEFRLTVVRSLLAHGADPNVADCDGYMPLQGAACLGYSEVVRELIRYGAEADSRSDYGSTALMVAAPRRHAETVEALLTLGADPNLANANGCTALYWSVYVEEGKELPQSDAEQRLAVVRSLLSHGADPNLADIVGNTPLQSAAYLGYIEIVRELVTHGAQVNHQCSDGISALMTACLSGSAETVQFLLDQGADRSLPDAQGATAVDWAIEAEHAEIAALIRGYNE